MNRMYQKLKDDEYFKDKLRLDETDNCLIIILHEYLSILYLEGSYEACYDEGYLCYTRTKGDTLYNRPSPFAMHCHIQDDDEALEAIIDFARGDEDEIFIEDTRLFAFTPLRVITKEKFEKKKARYMAKKYLRIYSKNLIIKRNVLRA